MPTSWWNVFDLMVEQYFAKALPPPTAFPFPPPPPSPPPTAILAASTQFHTPWCAPDAESAFNMKGFLTGCTKAAAWRVVTNATATLPLPPEIVMLNVGANKGYEVAKFLELVAPERNVHRLRWYGALRSYAESIHSGYLKFGAIGGCIDGRAHAPRKPLPPPPPRSRLLGRLSRTSHAAQRTVVAPPPDRRVRVHAFEMMNKTAKALSHVVNATGVSDIVTVHMVPVVDVTRGVRKPATGMAGDESVTLCRMCRRPGVQEEPGLPDMEEVTATSLDEFLASGAVGASTIYRVAIAAGGYDSSVLNGLRATLRARRVRFLEFEVTPTEHWLTRSLEKTLRWLAEDAGYRCFLQGQSLLPASAPCWQKVFEAKRRFGVLCAAEPAVLALLSDSARTDYERRAPKPKPKSKARRKGGG